MGAEGYPYGFNLTTEDGKPVVSFAYALESLPRLRNASGVGSAERDFGSSLRKKEAIAFTETDCAFELHPVVAASPIVSSDVSIKRTAERRRS
jgi:hypothetical protein